MNTKELEAVRDFLAADASCCHAIGKARPLPSDRQVEAWMDAASSSAAREAERIASWLGVERCEALLEIGCSTGMKTMALARRLGCTIAAGVDPEYPAVRVARMLNLRDGRSPVRFLQGVGERLPFQERTFDLILCCTVIEHVHDVDAVIQEMARVLRPGGRAYVEAPNYFWPYEPHLQIWTIPLLGKGFIRWCARLQGKAEQASFLDHLQLVTPRRLEKVFAAAGLRWRRLLGVKVQRIASGQEDTVKYGLLGRLVRLSARGGVLGPLMALAERMGIYPSLYYELERR